MIYCIPMNLSWGLICTFCRGGDKFGREAAGRVREGFLGRGWFLFSAPIATIVLLCLAAGGGSPVFAQTVPNLDSLRGVVGSDGERVQVQGYYRPDDGNGGLFVWKSQSEASGDGGLIVRPRELEPGTLGRWHRVGSRHHLRAGWYGLHPDSTNNHESVQQALDAAADVEGTVRLPKGRFGMSEIIYLPKGTVLEGQGDDTVLAYYGSENVSIRMYKDGASVRRLTIDGRVPERVVEDTLSRAVFGVYITDASNCRVEDVTIVGAGYKLASELGKEERHNTLDLNGQAITIVSSAESREEVTGNVVRNVLVRDPEGRLSFAIRLYTHFQNQQRYAPEVGAVRENHIVGNTVVGTSKNAIELVGPNTVENYVGYNTVMDARGYGGIEADFGASMNTFEGNTLKGYSGHSALLKERDQAFIAFQSAGGQSAEGRELTTQRAFGNRFINNQVTKIQPAFPEQDVKGVLLLNTDHAAVDGLYLRGVQVSQGESIAVDVENAADIYVRDGNVSGTTYCIVTKRRTRNVRIENGRFRDCRYGYRSFGGREGTANVQIVGSQFHVTDLGIDGRNVVNLQIERTDVQGQTEQAVPYRQVDRDASSANL